MVLAGLGHAGLQGSSAYSQRELWAPSPMPEVAGREVPKEMELEDIAETVAAFAAAARLAVDSGCGGRRAQRRPAQPGPPVPVRPDQPAFGDEYGSDKLRFAREVLTAVRAAIPGAVIVGCGCPATSSPLGPA